MRRRAPARGGEGLAEPPVALASSLQSVSARLLGCVGARRSPTGPNDGGAGGVLGRGRASGKGLILVL